MEHEGRRRTGLVFEAAPVDKLRRITIRHRFKVCLGWSSDSKGKPDALCRNRMFYYLTHSMMSRKKSEKTISGTTLRHRLEMLCSTDLYGDHHPFISGRSNGPSLAVTFVTPNNLRESSRRCTAYLNGNLFHGDHGTRGFENDILGGRAENEFTDFGFFLHPKDDFVDTLFFREVHDVFSRRKPCGSANASHRGCCPGQRWP